MVCTYSIDPWHTNIGFVCGTGFGDRPGRVHGLHRNYLLLPERHYEVFGAIHGKGAASLDTGVKQRDDHLRSADFFEVKKYPEITFRSTTLAQRREDIHRVRVDLTIKNVTKQIALPVNPA